MSVGSGVVVVAAGWCSTLGSTSPHALSAAESSWTFPSLQHPLQCVLSGSDTPHKTDAPRYTGRAGSRCTPTINTSISELFFWQETEWILRDQPLTTHISAIRRRIDVVSLSPD